MRSADKHTGQRPGDAGRQPRAWKNEGVVIHLYPGKIYIYIYDLTRALKEVGGDTTRLFEVDILRRTNHDVSRDGGIYAALLRIAVLGWVDRLPDVPLVGTDEAAVGRADSPELVELPPRRFGVDLM